jgi:STE24 endopeptidase
MKPESIALAALALLALGLVGLGLLPWARTGTPWRPARPALEAAAARHWDAELVQKGRDYRSSGYGRWFLRKGVVGLLLVLVVATGAHLALRKVPGTGGIAGATLAVLAVFAALDVVNLPFQLAAYENARRFGISTQSAASWWTDWVKGNLIGYAVTGVVAAALFFLMAKFPRSWPLPATVAAGVGGIVFALLVPLVVDPLFNTFTPLDDPALKSRFLELAKAGGVPAQDVLVSDASTRTTAVNAYFTGFGPTRRIVVYDTMVEKLPPKESELILAHEVGHWAKQHIVKGLVAGTLALGVVLLLAHLLLGRLFARGAFGLTGPLDPAAIPVYVLLYWLGLFLALPIENAVSRSWEAEADRFALDLTGDAETQVAVERSLGRTNLADLVPPPLVETLLYTHPRTLDRIAQAEEWRRAHPVSPEVPAP